MVDHTACPPDAHDRDPGTAIRDGAPVDQRGLLLCADCHAPLMYCTTINDYAHVDPAAPPCFLVSATPEDLGRAVPAGAPATHEGVLQIDRGIHQLP